MKGPAQSSSDNARLDRAISWHLRLNSGDSDETDWVACAEWLEADEENRLAFERVESLSEQLDADRDAIRAGLQETEAAGNVVFPSVWRRARQVVATPRRLATLVLVAASLLIAVGLDQTWLAAPTSRVYATRVGENRTVALADGSVIKLNTNSRIVVALAEGERDVTLDRGEALFRVAKDKSRPFIVAVGDRRVRVVGTVFNILRHRGRMVVTVAEGIVAVRPAVDSPLNGPDARATLTAGRQLIHREGSDQTRVRDVDPMTVLAWEDGNLTYEDIPLSEVLHDLNRYFPIQVQPQNAAVGALRFSGVLKIDNETAVLHRLEEFLPVTVERAEHKIILRPRADTR